MAAAIKLQASLITLVPKSHDFPELLDNSQSLIYSEIECPLSFWQFKPSLAKEFSKETRVQWTFARVAGSKRIAPSLIYRKMLHVFADIAHPSL